MRLALFFLLLFASRTARAQGADADAYCTWVRSAAGSEAAPLVAPALFAGGGIVAGPEAGQGASALPPTPRVTAGASYSFSNLFRGIAVADQAAAECVRYRTEVVLRTFVQTYRDGESRSGLTASLAVYDAAEPKATALFERVQASAAAGRTTAVELAEAALRLDELRSRQAEARRRLEALLKRPLPTAKEIATAIAEQPGREAEVERQAARVRRTMAWDLSVRGGYDRFFGVRDHVPLFATAALTVNLGILFQPAADQRAEAAREVWAKTQVEGPGDRAAQVIAKLKAMRSEAKTRLETTAGLAAELEQRHRVLEATGTDAARVAAATVWFALVQIKAERAFFGALLGEVDSVLVAAPRGAS